MDGSQNQIQSFYSTYEELKLRCGDDTYHSPSSFYSTYEELKR